MERYTIEHRHYHDETGKAHFVGFNLVDHKKNRVTASAMPHNWRKLCAYQLTDEQVNDMRRVVDNYYRNASEGDPC